MLEFAKKYVGLLGKIVLILTFGLGVLVATADDHELVGLDFYRPATFLRLVTSRAREVRTYLRTFLTAHPTSAPRSREAIRPEGATLPPVK